MVDPAAAPSGRDSGSGPASSNGDGSAAAPGRPRGASGASQEAGPSIPENRVSDVSIEMQAAAPAMAARAKKRDWSLTDTSKVREAGHKSLKNLDLFYRTPSSKTGASLARTSTVSANMMLLKKNVVEPTEMIWEKEATEKDGDDPQLLGTLMGVFVPCLQNILGVILFIRLSWIVGQAGVSQTLAIVGICCICTFLTALSLSAIATNGQIAGGGPYFLIGRSLGPEIGVSVGIAFYLGTAIAGSMYILGAVETILTSIPDAMIFSEEGGKITITDFQVWGTIVTGFIGCVVMLGMQRLSKIAPFFLIPVLVSVLCIFLGVWTNKADGQGFTGFKGPTIADNSGSVYVNTDSAGTPDPNGSFGWTFQSLLALFFPSVTGIMAGSNRSASLKDAQRSIPIGTLGAQLTTTTIYMLSIVFFGGVATRNMLLNDRLLAVSVAWPAQEVVSVGITLSTIGAGLQSLAGAPRLLQAIANDEIIPLFNRLKTADPTAEPRLCQAVTFCVTLGCVLVGNLDVITPIITMFFLMCYIGVNMSCFLLDSLQAPSWRPRWQYYHRYLSLLGGMLCFVVMLLISWIFTVASLSVVALLYYYIGTRHLDDDWGDGVKTLRIRLAIRILLGLGDEKLHPKNWYPAPLILAKPWGLLAEDEPCHPKLLEVVKYFQPKGRYAGSLAMLVSIIEEGEARYDTNITKQQLTSYALDHDFHGFVEVFTAVDVKQAFKSLLQISGLGNLKPNMVCLRFPEMWHERANIPHQMTAIIRNCYDVGKAIVMFKDISEFPDANKHSVVQGTIDLYWITRDGGLMLLLGQLLKRNVMFRKCKLRIFVLCTDPAAEAEMKRDIDTFIYKLRVSAETVVINIVEQSMDEQDYKHLAAMKEDSKGVQLGGLGGGQGGWGSASSNMGSDAGDRASDVSESYLAEEEEELPPSEKVEGFMIQSVKINRAIRDNSAKAALVLVSLPPPPPPPHPSFLYMEYLQGLIKDIPPGMLVRGYKRNVVTLFQ